MSARMTDVRINTARWQAMQMFLNHPHRDTVIAICKEVAEATIKHPVWPREPIHAAAVVAEESGELVRASLQYVYEGGDVEAIRTEALHTAATCVRLLAWLPTMDQFGPPAKETHP